MATVLQPVALRDRILSSFEIVLLPTGCDLAFDEQYSIVRPLDEELLHRWCFPVRPVIIHHSTHFFSY